MLHFNRYRYRYSGSLSFLALSFSFDTDFDSDFDFDFPLSQLKTQNFWPFFSGVRWILGVPCWILDIRLIFPRLKPACPKSLSSRRQEIIWKSGKKEGKGPCFLSFSDVPDFLIQPILSHPDFRLTSFCYLIFARSAWFFTKNHLRPLIG